MAKTTTEKTPPQPDLPPTASTRALVDPVGLAREYTLAVADYLKGQNGRTLQPASQADVRRLLNLALQLVS